MSFGKVCVSCGCCCKRIDKAVKNSKILKLYGISGKELDFPYSWSESGRCEMLDDDNKCKVYEKRPNICNVDWVAEKLDIQKIKFYRINARVCNKFMDEDNIPENLRINILDII